MTYTFEQAQMIMADAVKADPFEMEFFRKFAFFCKVVVHASRNGKSDLAVKIMRTKVIPMRAKIGDVTGVIDALYEGAAKSAY